MNSLPMPTPLSPTRWRAVACDLDGTLLRSDATVSDHSRDVLRRLVAQGVTVMLASGRPPASVRSIARSIGLEGPMVATNGAITFHTDGTVLFRETLSREEMGRLLDTCARHEGVDWQLICGFDWMISAMRPAVLGEATMIDRTPEIVSAEVARTTEPDKIILNALPDTLVELERELAEQGFVTFLPGPGWLEVMAPGVTKLTGIRRVADMLGFSVDEVVAFGDHDNDPAMLAGCGLGVAMGHGSPRALAAADRIIGSNEDDAVAHFLAAEILGDRHEPSLSAPAR